jgi:hypothetical protein
MAPVTRQGPPSSESLSVDPSAVPHREMPSGGKTLSPKVHGLSPRRSASGGTKPRTYTKRNPPSREKVSAAIAMVRARQVGSVAGPSRGTGHDENGVSPRNSSGAEVTSTETASKEPVSSPLKVRPSAVATAVSALSRAPLTPKGQPQPPPTPTSTKSERMPPPSSPPTSPEASKSAVHQSPHENFFFNIFASRAADLSSAKIAGKSPATSPTMSPKSDKQKAKPQQNMIASVQLVNEALSADSSDEGVDVDPCTLNDVSAFIDSLRDQKRSAAAVSDSAKESSVGSSSLPTDPEMLKEIGQFIDALAKPAAAKETISLEGGVDPSEIIDSIGEDGSLPRATEAGIEAFIDALRKKTASPQDAAIEKVPSSYLYISSSEDTGLGNRSDSGVGSETHAEIAKYIDSIAKSNDACQDETHEVGLPTCSNTFEDAEDTPSSSAGKEEDSRGPEVSSQHSIDDDDIIMALRKVSSEESGSHDESEKAPSLQDTFSIDQVMDFRSATESHDLSESKSTGSRVKEQLSSPSPSVLVGEVCLGSSTEDSKHRGTVNQGGEWEPFDKTTFGEVAAPEDETDLLQAFLKGSSPEGNSRLETSNPFLVKMQGILKDLPKSDMESTIGFLKEATVLAESGSKKDQARLLIRARRKGIPVSVVNQIVGEFLGSRRKAAAKAAIDREREAKAALDAHRRLEVELMAAAEKAPFDEGTDESRIVAKKIAAEVVCDEQETTLIEEDDRLEAELRDVAEKAAADALRWEELEAVRELEAELKAAAEAAEAERKALAAKAEAEEAKREAEVHATFEKAAEEEIEDVDQSDAIAAFFARMAALKAGGHIPDADLEAITSFIGTTSNDEEAIEVDATVGYVKKDLAPKGSEEEDRPWWEGIIDDNVDSAVQQATNAIMKGVAAHEMQEGLSPRTPEPTFSLEEKEAGGTEAVDGDEACGQPETKILGKDLNVAQMLHASKKSTAQMPSTKKARGISAKRQNNLREEHARGASAKLEKRLREEQEARELKELSAKASVAPVPKKAVAVNGPMTPGGVMRELERRFNERDASMMKQVALYWRSPWEIRPAESDEPKAAAVVPEQPPPICGVAAAKSIARWGTKRSRRLQNPWRTTYKERTKAHSGYTGVDVYSLYDLSTVQAEEDLLDSIPWEHREVKQRFLHEQSLSFSRNWFGSFLRKRGNDKYREPVAHPKSMEMPMESIHDHEWADDWYLTWQARNRSPRSGSRSNDDDKASHFDDDASSLRSDYSGSIITEHENSAREDETVYDSDDDSWEEPPECGTLANVHQKIGERVSRVTPHHTSRLRRSRWRKKYFPRGTFPYRG